METLAEATLTVLVTPAKDLPNQWVAHCLNIDVVTQGDSIQHAFAMAREAVLQVVADDISQGLDPFSRPSAPEQCWEQVTQTIRHGVPFETIQDERQVSAAVGQLLVAVQRKHTAPEIDMIPPAWQIAALGNLRESSRVPC
jgi:predicted RNase H-like HicB family nuclease